MYTLQWALLALVPLAAMSARPGFLLETLDALQSLNKQISLQDHQYNKELPGALRAFIRLVPKAELHVHVEGTLEPELMLAMAARNGLPAPYPNAEAARAAYDTFSNLQVRPWGQHPARTLGLWPTRAKGTWLGTYPWHCRSTRAKVSAMRFVLIKAGPLFLLQDFLDMYYTGCSVLRTERDYYDLAMSYFKVRRSGTPHFLLC